MFFYFDSFAPKSAAINVKLAKTSYSAGILLLCIIALVAFIVRSYVLRRRARRKLERIRAGDTGKSLAKAGLMMFGVPGKCKLVQRTKTVKLDTIMMTRENMTLPNMQIDRSFQPRKQESLEEMLLNYR